MAASWQSPSFIALRNNLALVSMGAARHLMDNSRLPGKVAQPCTPTLFQGRATVFLISRLSWRRRLPPGRAMIWPGSPHPAPRSGWPRVRPSRTAAEFEAWLAGIGLIGDDGRMRSLKDAAGARRMLLEGQGG
jgi:hypothetical protein